MLRLDFINVGYGDAILIRETGGERPFTMLVDAGDTRPLRNDEKTRRIYAWDYLKNEGVHHLDLFAVTHLHRDHLSGAERVLEDVSTDRLFVNYLPDEAHRDAVLSADTPDGPLPAGIVKGLSEQIALTNRLRAGGTKIDVISHHQTIALTEALSLEVTTCGRYLYERYQTELDRFVAGAADRYAIKLMRAYLNLTSIRLILTYHGKRVFLPSDAYATYWDVDAEGPCHILKVPHHGSPAGVTETLLKALKPENAVVTVSSFDADKPAAASVELLQKYVAHLYFTDAVDLCGVKPAYHEAVTLTID